MFVAVFLFSLAVRTRDEDPHRLLLDGAVVKGRPLLQSGFQVRVGVLDERPDPVELLERRTAVVSRLLRP